MWFKRRKKTEQDHALSESLRSLQSLLSENGRREPSLSPKKTPPDPRSEDEPVAGSGHQGATGRRTPSTPEDNEQPAAPESGNRWRDLNLSFDAEPVAPRSRRETEQEPENEDDDRQEAAEAQTGTDSAGDSGDQADAAPPPEDHAQAEPVGAGRPTADPEPAASPVGIDAAPDEEAVDEPGIEPDAGGDPQPAGEDEQPVVYYDDPKDLAPGIGVERETDEYGLRGDEPDLEIDLSDVDFAGVEPPGDDRDLEDAPPADSAPARDEPESVVEGKVPDTRPAEAGQEEPSPGEASTAAGETAVDGHGEDQLHLELGLEDIPEDDIPTLTDVVYMPDFETSDAATEAAAPDLEEPAVERDVPAVESRDTSVVEPETAIEPEPVSESGSEEALEPDMPVEVVSAPEAREPAAPAAVEKAAADIPPPGRRESVHDYRVEQCIGNLRVRLQLMGLDELSPEQEKELHDTLVDLLDDFSID